MLCPLTFNELSYAKVCGGQVISDSLIGFFDDSTSPRSCLMCWCSAVRGLPIPLWPDFSASNWLTQRLTALSPSVMSLHTWLMLKPWALTIWTTCSWKSVSNSLLDFGWLTVYAISVFNNLSGCLFLLDHPTFLGQSVDSVFRKSWIFPLYKKSHIKMLRQPNSVKAVKSLVRIDCFHVFSFLVL